MRNTNEVISWKLSVELANNNADLAKELLAMFVEELTGTATLLKQSHQEKDWESLKNQTHKLHGGACYVGVPLLKEAAKTLEKSLKSNIDEERIYKDFNALIEQIEVVCEVYNSKEYES